MRELPIQAQYFTSFLEQENLIFSAEYTTYEQFPKFGLLKIRVLDSTERSRKSIKKIAEHVKREFTDLGINHAKLWTFYIT